MAVVFVKSCAMTGSQASFAYRPFDSTDAGVVAPGRLELGVRARLAMEFGVLLPIVPGDREVGATCSGILSQAWGFPPERAQ